MSFSEDVDTVRRLVEALLSQGRPFADTLDQISKMLGSLPTGGPPVVAPTVQVRSGFREYRVSSITATTFLNQEDEGVETQGAYGMKFPAGTGLTLRGVALPARVPKGTKVRIGGKEELVIDVGPWNVDDPYWLVAGQRPQSETGTDRRGRRTNKAGIDLTPPVMADVLGVPVERVYSTSPSAVIDVVIMLPEVARLSAHFTVEEAERSATAKARGIANVLPSDLIANAQRMAAVLEDVRSVVGPFSPNSWYRSPELNSSIEGSAKDSSHLRALAADVSRTPEMWAGVSKLKCRVYVEASCYHLSLENEQTQTYAAGVDPAAWEV